MSKRRTCAACWEAKDPEEYTKTQLSKGAKARRCKLCVDNKKEVRTDEAAAAAPAAKKAKVDSGNVTVQAQSLDAAETPEATEKANVDNSTVMAPTQPSSGAATPGATKKEKDNGNVVTPASNGKSNKNKLKVCCKRCNKSKKPSHFPKDYHSLKFEEDEDDNAGASACKSQTCVCCIFDAVPRTCRDCNKAKPKESFSEHEWCSRTPRSMEGGRLNGTKTVQEIEASAKKIYGQLCLECQAFQMFAEERKARLIMDKHAIECYDFESPVTANESPNKLQCSEIKPKDFLGEYEIVLYSAEVDGEVQNQTTKGTVVLWMGPSKKDEEEDSDTEEEEDSDKEEEDSRKEEDNGDQKQEGKLFVRGTVDFHEDMRELSSNLCLQRDFELFEDTDPDKVWKGCLKAKMTDPDVADVVHCDGSRGSAHLKCIEKRAALPWMKFGQPKEKVEFDTLEEAEAMARQHVEKGSDKPKPIFFLEPGDLVLHVDWSDDFREPSPTDCVLRKRLTKPSS